MVEINYLGHSCFKISGKEISIITDPFDPEMVGLKLPKLEADVVTISHQHKDHNNTAGLRGNFICFDTPGEYEIKNTEIIGTETYHDLKQGAERGKNTVFVYDVDSLKICHLGDLGHELTGGQLEAIDGVDVLLIPVGGTVTLGPKEATRVISAISPKIVIPMHYKAPKMTNLETLDNFYAELGKTPKKLDSLKIKKNDLSEELEVFELKIKS